MNKDLFRMAKDIESQQARAGLVITNEKRGHLYGGVDQFIKNYLRINPNKKLCMIDLNLFENTLELEFPESLKFDSFLRLALRNRAYNYVHRNDVQFAFFSPPADYVICEMHLIYVFERLLFSILEKFEPDLILCLASSDFSRNARSENFILSGDCRPFLFEAAWKPNSQLFAI